MNPAPDTPQPASADPSSDPAKSDPFAFTKPQTVYYGLAAVLGVVGLCFGVWWNEHTKRGARLNAESNPDGITAAAISTSLRNADKAMITDFFSVAIQEAKNLDLDSALEAQGINTGLLKAIARQDNLSDEMYNTYCQNLYVTSLGLASPSDTVRGFFAEAARKMDDQAAPLAHVLLELAKKEPDEKIKHSLISTLWRICQTELDAEPEASAEIKRDVAIFLIDVVKNSSDKNNTWALSALADVVSNLNSSDITKDIISLFTISSMEEVSDVMSYYDKLRILRKIAGLKDIKNYECLQKTLSTLKETCLNPDFSVQTRDSALETLDAIHPAFLSAQDLSELVNQAEEISDKYAKSTSPITRKGEYTLLTQAIRILATREAVDGAVIVKLINLLEQPAIASSSGMSECLGNSLYQMPIVNHRGLSILWQNRLAKARDLDTQINLSVALTYGSEEDMYRGAAVLSAILQNGDFAKAADKKNRIKSALLRCADEIPSCLETRVLMLIANDMTDKSSQYRAIQLLGERLAEKSADPEGEQAATKIRFSLGSVLEDLSKRHLTSAVHLLESILQNNPQLSAEEPFKSILDKKQPKEEPVLSIDKDFSPCNDGFFRKCLFYIM